ncbi:hypothetical protein [Lutibacter sp.]
MKTINEKFTDEEFEKMQKVKGSQNWHDFILQKCSQKSNGDS